MQQFHIIDNIIYISVSHWGLFRVGSVVEFQVPSRALPWVLYAHTLKNTLDP
jgi:hypothetical protein